MTLIAIITIIVITTIIATSSIFTVLNYISEYIIWGCYKH